MGAELCRVTKTTFDEFRSEYMQDVSDDGSDLSDDGSACSESPETEASSAEETKFLLERVDEVTTEFQRRQLHRAEDSVKRETIQKQIDSEFSFLEGPNRHWILRKLEKK